MNTEPEKSVVKLNGIEYEIEIDAVSVWSVGDDLCTYVDFTVNNRYGAWVIDFTVADGVVCRSGMPEPRQNRSLALMSLFNSEKSASAQALAESAIYDECERAAIDVAEDFVKGAETVASYLEKKTGRTDGACTIDGFPGWRIECYLDTFTIRVCPPGEHNDELSWRDRGEERNQLLVDVLQRKGAFGDLHDYDTGRFIRRATREEMEASLDAAPEGIIEVDGNTCYVKGEHFTGEKDSE